MKIHIILRDCDTPAAMAAYRAAIQERLRAVYPEADLYLGSHDDGDGGSGVWVDDPPPVPYDVRLDIEQTLDAVWCAGAWRDD